MTIQSSFRQVPRRGDLQNASTGKSWRDKKEDNVVPARISYGHYIHIIIWKKF
jgi:hypothetical protein